MQQQDIFMNPSWSNIQTPSADRRKGGFQHQSTLLSRSFISADPRRSAAGFTGSCSHLTSYSKTSKLISGHKVKKQEVCNYIQTSILQSWTSGQMDWKPFRSPLKTDSGLLPVTDELEGLVRSQSRCPSLAPEQVLAASLSAQRCIHHMTPTAREARTRWVQQETPEEPVLDLVEASSLSAVQCKHFSSK